MTIFDYDCYRNYLKSLLLEKQDHNPRYSQRAFAKWLEITPSRLSEILNFKGHLSAKNTQRIAKLIFDKPVDRDYFVSLRELDLSTRRSETIALKNHLSQLRFEQSFAEVDFESHGIKQWYHYAILFVLQLSPEISPINLARSLNIDIRTVEIAINELVEHNFLQVGSWKITPNVKQLKTPDHMKSNQPFHRAMISKSLDAMYRFPVERRHFRTYLFTLRQEDYADLVHLIDEFCLGLTDRGSAQGHDMVYCLSSQLFPVVENFRNRHPISLD